MQHADLLLRANRDALKDFSMKALDEIIAAVLILAVNPHVAVRSRYSYPALRFKSPLAHAQMLNLHGIPTFPPAHVAGLKHLVNLRGGINKTISTDPAGCVQL